MDERLIEIQRMVKALADKIWESRDLFSVDTISPGGGGPLLILWTALDDYLMTAQKSSPRA